MSDRQFFDEWIAADYNRNFLLKPILDRIIPQDEAASSTDISALSSRLDADEARMNIFYQTIEQTTNGQAETAHEWCQHLHNEVDDIQASLSGKADNSALDSLSDQLSGKANISHNHEIEAINGLSAALNGKASSSALEALESNLDARTTALENWRSNRGAALSDVDANTSGLSVNVLGIGVMAASGTAARLQQFGNAINSINNRLRTREVVNA